MEKCLVIDKRMRKIEKDYLKGFGYNIIQLDKQNNVYEEISSHVDVFFSRIKDKVIVEPNVYDILKINYKHVIKGKSNIQKEYPFDISYNVCQIGKNVIHNFKYTDRKVKEVILEEKLNMININQGYSNCSISVVDENSAITSDKKVFEILTSNGIECLLHENEKSIKLLKNGAYSNMHGFIGGATTRIDNKFIIFGDINIIDKHGKIQKFIEKRGIDFVYFKGLDVIDYGGVIEL